MNNPRITCFPNKTSNDIYVENIKISSEQLLSILSIFPNRRVVAIIESDVSFQPALSLGESIQAKHYSSASRFIITCNKDELLCMMKHANIDDLEGLFIASVDEESISDEFICSLEGRASSMVKNGIADVSLSINFPEKEMVISLIKAKYSVKHTKALISNIFGFQLNTIPASIASWGQKERFTGIVSSL